MTMDIPNGASGAEYRALVLKSLQSLQDKVDLIMSNHLPHIELRLASLESYKKQSISRFSPWVQWVQAWSPVIVAILGIAAAAWGITKGGFR